MIPDAIARAIYQSDARPAVRVRNRRRGKGVPDGYEVRCRVCTDAKIAQQEAGEQNVHAYDPIWYTNESGTPARKRAEIIAGEHMVRHFGDDFPIHLPLPRAFVEDFMGDHEISVKDGGAHTLLVETTPATLDRLREHADHAQHVLGRAHASERLFRSITRTRVVLDAVTQEGRA